MYDTDTNFSLPLPAPFMVDNCTAAILAASCAGVAAPGLIRGIQAFSPVQGRMNMTEIKKGLTLIDDTYNANPASMAKALETLAQLSGSGTSIAVLGDMLELGDGSADLHREIGAKAAQLNISYLFVYGIEVRHLIDGALTAGVDPCRIYHGEKKRACRKNTGTLRACHMGSVQRIKGDGHGTGHP